MFLQFPKSNELPTTVFFLPTVLSIQKGYRQNTTDFSLEENELQATINISSANFAENGLFHL